MYAREEIRKSLKQALADMGLPLPDKLQIEPSRQDDHGDLSTNAALLLARQAKKKPREFAETLAEKLAEVCPLIEKIEVAGPGFCNIWIKPEIWAGIINEIESKKGAFGESRKGNGLKVLVEYVSANPTGPLHVGHGRGAALGDSVARLLRCAGFDVATEYYLNDAGRQMRILGLSIWLRMRQDAGEKVDFPEDCYQGEYIREIGRELARKRPELGSLPEEEAIEICREYGATEILREIKEDLGAFRCQHQRFASEEALGRAGAVSETLEKLRLDGNAYDKDGATWLKTAQYGDDHDRVLRKSDGYLTYFATDIAYHKDKFARGFEWLIDVVGADHHGYIPRMRAAIAEIGQDPDRLSFMLVQLVNLLRDGKKVSMSTRAGEFVTLAEVINEVGTDAARFMFLSRSSDSPLDFDLELAKKRTMDNPVYYVQYAHARICALLRRARERGMTIPENTPKDTLLKLSGKEEIALLRKLADYEDTVANAAQSLAPHHITRYLMELAQELHGYYARVPILDENDMALTAARLALASACGQVLKNGLFLLGVSAPESM